MFPSVDQLAYSFLNGKRADEDEGFEKLPGRVLRRHSCRNRLHSPDFKQRLNTVYYFKNFILLDSKRKATNQSGNHKLKFVRHRGGCCSWTHRPLTLSGFRFLQDPNAACPKAFGKSLDSILHILPFLPNFTCWGTVIVLGSGNRSQCISVAC